MPYERVAPWVLKWKSSETEKKVLRIREKYPGLDHMQIMELLLDHELEEKSAPESPRPETNAIVAKKSLDEIFRKPLTPQEIMELAETHEKGWRGLLDADTHGLKHRGQEHREERDARTDAYNQSKLDLQKQQQSPKKVVFSKGGRPEGFGVVLIQYVDRQTGELVRELKGGEHVKESEVKGA